MLVKMMMANIDVLCPWMPCGFQSARVVLKYLAVYIMLVANYLEFLLSSPVAG
jgi:hypothetical protein